MASMTHKQLLRVSPSDKVCQLSNKNKTEFEGIYVHYSLYVVIPVGIKLLIFILSSPLKFWEFYIVQLNLERMKINYFSKHFYN